MKIPNHDIYSVSNLNAKVRTLLEGNLGQIWLNGEISNLTSPSSGHWYLTLKDNKSQIRCAMFKGRNQTVNFRPTNGQQVLVKGNISVYEPRGDYQLLISSMLAAGEGLLAQEYQALKIKLAAEGLFAQETKRQMPADIKRIGIVTSPTGAAIKDVLQILNRRDPSIEVIIYPSMVQGTHAAKTIEQAINIANQRLEVDVILLTRGGGALEDLWCFNSEELAHCIYNSAIPIVSAVGHEIDTTISDYVADLRAPTPSAAAEVLSQDKVGKLNKLAVTSRQLKSSWQHYLLQCQRNLSLNEHRLSKQDPQRKLMQLVQNFDEMQFRLNAVFKDKINQHTFVLQKLASRLSQCTPKNKITVETKRLQYLTESLNQAIEHKLNQSKQNIQHKAQLLDSVNPLAILSRGYSITSTNNNQVIDNIDNIKLGDSIQTRLKQGLIESTVVKLMNNE